MSSSPYISWSPDGSGFTTTRTAYREFVQAARLRPLVATKLRELERGADPVAVGAAVRNAFFYADVPTAVAEAIAEAYDELGGAATDLPGLLVACKRCWGSLILTELSKCSNILSDPCSWGPRSGMRAPGVAAVR